MSEERNELGQFGTGNTVSKGRPKGSKNKITQQRHDLELALITFEGLPDRLLKIMKQVLDQAEEGCKQSQKLVFDKFVPNASADSDAPKQDGEKKYTFVLVDARSGQEVPADERKFIEGKVTVVQDVESTPV